MQCGDGEVRVIYQGELNPAEYLRALIPLPTVELSGLVTITATFCYATVTDPEDPGNYTRSGLDITFRPHVQRFATDTAVDPASHPFFKRSNFDTEHQRRRDAQEWETTVHQANTFRGSTLSQPVFDIHYNARTGGGAARDPRRIRYALVVTVRSRQTPDLYNRVLRTFAGRLEVLQPIITVPVRL